RTLGPVRRPGPRRGGGGRRCHVGLRSLAAPGSGRDARGPGRVGAAPPRPARRAHRGTAGARPAHAGGAPRPRRAGTLHRVAAGRPARDARYGGPAALATGRSAAAAHRTARRSPQPALRAYRMAAALDDTARALDRIVARGVRTPRGGLADRRRRAGG